MSTNPRAMPSVPPPRLAGHAFTKYPNGERMLAPVELPTVRAEMWHHPAGIQNDLLLECNEVAVLLSGRMRVDRTGDGRRQQGLARAGSAWICPAGTFETHVAVDGPGKWLHIFLPPALLELSAMRDYDLDPGKVSLGYSGGMIDPLIVQFAATFGALMDRGLEPADRLLLDGMKAALVARLLTGHSAERWQPAARTPALDPRRLDNVFAFIEANLGTELTLEELAREACLSPFHFARRFREATGTTPHRFVTERRIASAKARLARSRESLVEIALATGFGSQANFTRAFRKHTGLTPGQFRGLSAGDPEPQAL